MKFSRLLIIMLSVLSMQFFLGCSQKNSAVKRLDEKGVSQSYAEFRSKNISDIKYKFNIDLLESEKQDFYLGESIVNFDLKNKIDLTLDFLKGEVLKIIVNGKEVSDFKKNENFIFINSKNFKKGENSLSVSFKQAFSTTGSGFYKFVDKKDKSTYLYTDFEPYDANRFAPLFDQPNLKANYKLSVKTPKDWKVITSVQENSKSILAEGVEWNFPESKKFSTYIFSLHAGPYKVWREQADVNGRKIPMGLYARKSIASYVKPEFWFKISESGFKYFEEYFSTEYPYDKYDQVIVPDFNSGAMENVAAVTFNERFVSRAKTPLRSQRRSLANVILHEMAHMWFGNLVTMDWWNDLWLNESFATFMANSATFEATEFDGAWLSFFNRTKQWAYSEDQWRTTHPIEADIESTEVALTNFDGITYGKGASSLKQLVFLIGVEDFKKGLADYFKTYSESNTRLVDFMGKLQKYTKEDLGTWTKTWLQTAGLNSLSAVPLCAEGKLKSIDFKQGFVSGDSVYRSHKAKVALWSKTDVTKDPDLVFDFKYDGQSTKWTPEKEMDCPRAIYPNWDDHDYVDVVLDKKSLDTFSTKLSSIESPLLRSQVWAALWSMVKMAELEPKKVHEIMISQLDNEKDSTVLNSVVANAIGRGGNDRLYFYYIDQDLAEKDRTKITEFFKNKIVKTNDIDLKKILFGGWISMAQEKDLASVKSCFTKCDFKIGFEIDPDRRWWLVEKIAVYRDADFEKLLDSELKRDSGRRAQLAALSAKVLYAKDKKVWLDKIFSKESGLALKEKGAILGGIVTSTQKSEYLDFIEDSFKSYSGKMGKLPSRVQSGFAYRFAPFYCGMKKSKLSLNEGKIKSSTWSPSVKKVLLQSLDREERCLKIKKG